jgi:signal transduction histidine kinase
MERHDKYACVAVKDNGIGIAEEQLKHIFERFYRVDKSPSRSGGGAGLGLVISQRIAEIHNGYITI